MKTKKNYAKKIIIKYGYVYGVKHKNYKQKQIKQNNRKKRLNKQMLFNHDNIACNSMCRLLDCLVFLIK